jgi:hypothetical protein
MLSSFFFCADSECLEKPDIHSAVCSAVYAARWSGYIDLQIVGGMSGATALCSSGDEAFRAQLHLALLVAMNFGRS